MEVVILEDNRLQAEYLVENLEKIGVNPRLIETEFEFREQLESFVASPPEVFILDAMVRWTNPSRNMPLPPKDVISNNYHRAGVRLLELIRDAGVQSDVILYTVLAKEDLNISELENVYYVAKDADPSGMLSILKNLRQKKIDLGFECD